MFKQNKKTYQTTDTLIGQGSSAEGKLECDANLRIEGNFQGEIHCAGDVIVGETGEAISNIIAANVIVAGKVSGDISTQGRLTITKNGKIVGNVHVNNLIILEGGVLNGSSKMENAPTPVPNIKEKNKKEVQSEAG